MDIEHKTVKNTLYISIAGDLDNKEANAVRSHLDSIMSAKDFQKVIIDLSLLNYLDSTGIGVLLGRYKLLKTRSIPIYLSSPIKSVDKILSLAGLYEIMPKIIFSVGEQAK